MSTLANLDTARRELLHLGLRNPLINYRPLKSRGAQVIDERPRDLYTLLVQDGLKMYFLEQGDPAPPADLAQPSLTPREKQFTDNKLQTPYSTSDLQKRLLNTYYTARSYIEEQGVNILYLALGMLRWKETAQSAKVRRAPLVLIPVEIDRTNVNSRFYIRYTGLDISTNLSLAAKLRLDYALQLPELPPDETLDIDAYFTAVRTTILDHPHWEVDHTAVSLAFFSFSKFFIYNDLDPTHWPDTHPTLESLLHPDGFIEPPPAVGDDDLIDNYVNLSESHQVISADSTQLAALLDVRSGRNLVIQGPPGTGKSQTITNILADALGRGQKVLFVSEKMAALDVVKRRLDALGLGDAALELHSHKTTKRDLLDELGRVLSLGQPHDDGAFPDLPQLDKLTKRLNDYSTALNAPLAPNDLTPYDIYGYLIQLQNEFTAFPVPDLAALAAPLPPNWSPLPPHRAVLADLQSMLGRLGVPRAHPFWGSACLETRPGDEQKIRTHSTTAVGTLQTLRHTSHTLTQELTLTPPTTLAQAQTLSHTAQRLLAAPNLHSIRIDHPAWRENAFQLRPIFEAGIEISTLTQKYDMWLIPEAWQQEVLDVRQALKRHGQKLWRALIGDFRDAQNKLLGLCRTALPPDVPTQLRLVDAILHVQHLRPQIAQLEPTLHELFGQRWRGIEQSDWFDLAEAGNWLLRLYEQLDRLDPQLIPYLSQNFTYERRQNLRQLATAHDTALRDYQTQLHDQLLPLLHLPEADFPATFNEQETRLTRWAREAGRFGEWVAYVQWQQAIRAEAQNTAVFPFLTLANQWPHASTHLLHLYDIQRYSSLLTSTTAEQYALWQFDSKQQQAAITQFRQLDDTFLQRNRYKLAHQHWQTLPHHSGGGRMGLLLHEIGKKRQHLPIRQLMHETGDIIQRLKPIFMMSPLSIAMFLPPNVTQFDLVVFDEASQVRPVDAFGALLRAKQAVVVGDSRQLPPTAFFERALGEAQNTPTDDSASDHWQEGAEEFVEPEETALLGSITADNESILDLFVRQNAPQRLLRWHYRSRHESLIAISNDEFYEGQLRLFPSPHPRRAGLGLHLRHLPDTVYDRGKSRTNTAEATAVARAIMTHARDFPHLTLGVAAFSSAQRQAIEEALEKARLAESRYESFFQSHPVEPFFIKNLENVQGDERDVILISVGYGRDQEGKVWLNFGPLNQFGGERRLNVLITRARRQCVVFSNITAVDLDLRHTDSAGLHALRAYLAYAANPQNGPEIMDSEARRTRPLPFEDELARLLRQAGYDVARRVGQHGVVVDLAVRDPHAAAENGYQLGIECDGDSYARAGSARARDIIEPDVLAGLGWRIYRLWSTAWFRQPAQEKERLLTAVDEALHPPPEPTSQHPTPLAPHRDRTQIKRDAPQPLAPRQLPDYTTSALRFKLYVCHGWRRIPRTYELHSQNYHQFDPKSGQFTNTSRTLNSLQARRKAIYPQDLSQHKQLEGQVYARLYYDLTSGQFSVREQALLVTDKQYAYLYYDPFTRTFYNKRKLANGRTWRYEDHEYDPKSWYVRRNSQTYGQQKLKDLPDMVAYADDALTTAVRKEADWVAKLVQDEGPIHQEELERAFVRAAGLRRRTAPIAKMTQQAARLAAVQGKVVYRAPFYYPLATAEKPTFLPVQPRSRRQLPQGSRTLDFVADEEITAVVALVVEDACGILPADIPAQVSTLLGFGTLGTDNQNRILRLAANMVRDGQLGLTGDTLVQPPGTADEPTRQTWAEQFLATLIAPEPPAAAPEPTPKPAHLPALPAYTQSTAQIDLFHRPGWHGARGDRQLTSGTRYEFDPRAQQFLATTQPWQQNTKHLDLPVKAAQLGPGLRFFAPLSYDLTSGELWHGGYLTAVDESGRSERFYRLWRDPASGQLYGRRQTGRTDLGTAVFGSADVRYDPLTGALSDMEQMSIQATDTAVASIAQLHDSLHEPEQAAILQILAAEAPIHTAELERRFMEAAGYRGHSAIAQDVARRVAASLNAAGKIVLRGDFWWLTDSLVQTAARPRDRRKLPQVSRRMGYVAGEEVALALVRLLQYEPDTAVDDIPLVLARWLGLPKPSGAQQSRVGRVLAWLQEHGYVKQVQSQWRVLGLPQWEKHPDPPDAIAPNETSDKAENTAVSVIRDPQTVAILALAEQLPPYERANFTLDKPVKSWPTADPGDIKMWLAQVVEAESPVRLREAMQTLFGLAGKASTKFELFAQAARALTQAGKIEMQKDFLWCVGQEGTAVRRRHDFPDTRRSFYDIAPEEIEAAVALLLETLPDLRRDDLPGALGRLFFNLTRVAGSTATPIEQILTKMEEAERLLVDDDGAVLVLPPEQERIEVSHTAVYRVAELPALQGKYWYWVNEEERLDWLWRIVQVESPVHLHMVARRLNELTGRFVLADDLQEIADMGQTAELFVRRGDFLWLPEMDTEAPPVRDRGNLNYFLQQVQYVAEEELLAGVLVVLAELGPVSRADLARPWLTALGLWMSASAPAERQLGWLNPLVDVLVAHGRVVEQDGLLTLPAE